MLLFTNQLINAIKDNKTEILQVAPEAPKPEEVQSNETYDLQKEVGGVDNVNINCLFDVFWKIVVSYHLEKSNCRCERKTYCRR